MLIVFIECDTKQYKSSIGVKGKHLFVTDEVGLLCKFSVLGCFQLTLVHHSNIRSILGLTLLLLHEGLCKSVFGFILFLIQNQKARTVVDQLVFDTFVVLLVADQSSLVVSGAGLVDQILLWFVLLRQFESVCCVLWKFGLVLVRWIEDFILLELKSSISFSLANLMLL